MEDAVEVFLEVVLADEEEERSVFLVVDEALDFGDGGFEDGFGVGAVFHDGDFAAEAVVAEDVGGAVVDRPDGVALVEEVDDEVDGGFGDGFGVSDFEGVVVEFAVEGGDEGDVEFFGDAGGFEAGGEGTVGVDEVEGDGFELFAVAGAEPGDADAVEFGGDFEAGGEDGVETFGAFGLGVVGGDVIDGVAEFFEFFAVGEGDAADAVEVGWEGITKLPDNHGGWLFLFGFVDEVSDEVEFVVGGVDEGESVGGFVTDGGEAESTEAKEVVEEAGLFVGDVFDAGEFNDVGGFGEERGLGEVEEALVGDEEFVGEVDF